MIERLELPDKPKDVVMRFAPNPNGPATLGSARGIVINSYLVKRYGGKFILRFDDTDPKLKKPLKKAYRWYQEDMKWLEAEPDQVVVASERIPKYYDFAQKLIELEKAYVCLCEREEFKKLKDMAKACPHRETNAEDNLALWQDMLNNKFGEGEAVLRIKTDIKSPDPALRDWVAFRILRAEHPLVGKRYVVWPMLDFESAIEDHVLGVTHIIRGKDLMDSEKKQIFIYDYLGWKYPKTLHWGRLRLADYGKLSTSEMAKGIEEGRYTGWDDPRLPTIRALGRRGITSGAIRNSMLALGLSESDIAISMENVYAENRKILDPIAGRYFFVEEGGYDLKTENPQKKTIRLPINPNKKFEGTRDTPIAITDTSTSSYIPEKDAQDLKEGDIVKLIGQSFVKIIDVDDSNQIIHSEPVGKTKGAKKIHWTKPPEYVDERHGHVNADILMPDGSKKTGYCEYFCQNLDIGDIIQFERFGFVRLDSKDPLVFCFGHK